jgi:hypothetical protein
LYQPDQHRGGDRRTVERLFGHPVGHERAFHPYTIGLGQKATRYATDEAVRIRQSITL